MSYKINEENLEVVFTETFSFECNVKYRLENIIENIKCELIDIDINEDDIDEERVQKINEVNAKEFTKEDYANIMHTIVSHWEYETCDGFDNRSIFDEDIIDDGIYMWLEEEFEYDFKGL